MFAAKVFTVYFFTRKEDLGQKYSELLRVFIITIGQVHTPQINNGHGGGPVSTDRPHEKKSLGT